MDHTLNSPQLSYHDAFVEMLDTLPIMPKKLVTELSQKQFDTQCATFFGYILRTGAILLGDNRFPDIDVQSVEPQLESKEHIFYIYFNLVKAMYLHFRGITDQARECCEKTFMVINNTKKSPTWKMVNWSYWLVHRQVSYFFIGDSADRL